MAKKANAAVPGEDKTQIVLPNLSAITIDPKYVLLFQKPAMELLNIATKPTFYRLLKKHQIKPVYLNSHPRYRLSCLYELIDKCHLNAPPIEEQLKNKARSLRQQPS